jgi:hypothetical protein
MEETRKIDAPPYYIMHDGYWWERKHPASYWEQAAYGLKTKKKISDDDYLDALEAVKGKWKAEKKTCTTCNSDITHYSFEERQEHDNGHLKSAGDEANGSPERVARDAHKLIAETKKIQARAKERIEQLTKSSVTKRDSLPCAICGSRLRYSKSGACVGCRKISNAARYTKPRAFDPDAKTPPWDGVRIGEKQPKAPAAASRASKFQNDVAHRIAITDSQLYTKAVKKDARAHDQRRKT